jgi:hypothetical protein
MMSTYASQTLLSLLEEAIKFFKDNFSTLMKISLQKIKIKKENV